MGFSLNSLEAEQLKHALQRDSAVSGITLNQNQAFNNFIHDLWRYTRHKDRGGEKMNGRMLDRGQVEMEGVGGSPPPRDVCGSQAKEMLQPRKGG
ncbi:hypothetical protein NQZ68_002980 [Dissostichus eleginoides]|nr:hypothetical protein NQZ68_002980 [Dissostichus eleginoides]